MFYMPLTDISKTSPFLKGFGNMNADASLKEYSCYLAYVYSTGIPLINPLPERRSKKYFEYLI